MGNSSLLCNQAYTVLYLYLKRPNMNISGIVVHAHPDNIDKVRARLEKMDGVEVHAAGADGKMVVTIERNNDQETTDLFDKIGKTPGVLSTAMVYHHFEPDSEQAA